MSDYIIHPLVVGCNETDQGIMTYQRHYGQRIWLPVYVFYLEGGEDAILVDTGLEHFMCADEMEKALGFRALEFEEALRQLGLKPEDVDIIIHTHLHNDHCENDYKCPNAKVYVQRAEYDFMKNPHPIDHRYDPELLEGVKEVVLLEGDQDICDGIKVLFTPGHTPGTQSVVVDTQGGKAVIAGFCCNERNFPENGNAIPCGVHTDAIQAYESGQKVLKEADLLIPLHASMLGKKRSIS